MNHVILLVDGGLPLVANLAMSLLDTVFWLAVQWVADLERTAVLLMWFAWMTALIVRAFMLQRMMVNEVRSARQQGREPTSLWRLELRRFSHLLVPPLWIRHVWQQWKQGRASEAEAAQEAIAPQEWLVPSIGPAYFIAANAVLVCYIVAEWLKLLLGPALSLPSKNHAWNALLFGESLYGGPLLTMRGLPSLAFALSALFWTALWVSIAFFVRLGFGGSLMVHGASADAVRHSKLRLWREKLGMRQLVGADETFKKWAAWAAGALLLISLLSTVLVLADRMPLTPQAYVVGVIVTLGWGLHLLLRGNAHVVEDVLTLPEERRVPPVPGWDAVYGFLQHEHGLHPLLPVEERAVGRFRFATKEETAQVRISPLIPQEFLVGGEALKLTQMQAHVLAALEGRSAENPTEVAAPKHGFSVAKTIDAHQAHVATNLYVASPEGTGKSLLAALSALNHVLLHAQSVLIVCASDVDAQRMIDGLRAQTERTSLRWSVQVRLAGDDLLRESLDGTVPDIVVCTLDWLALSYLAHAQNMNRLTETLGLIVVEDADAYHGAMAAHAQLSFARLNLLLSRSLRAVSGDILGGDSVSMLVLSSLTQENYLKAAEGLVKRSLTPMYFLPNGVDATDSKEKASGAEPAEQASDDAQPGDSRSGVSERGSTEQAYVFDFGSFLNARDENIGFLDLVDACEACGVPWTYWRADAGREERTRVRRHLPTPPRFQRHDPAEAAVVFVEGRFTHVQREFDRLTCAGRKFLQSPVEGERCVALIRIVDREEQMAFDVRDGGGSLTHLLERLPMPVVHLPAPEVSEAHLSSELTQRPLELQEILTCFGAESLTRIYALAKRGRITVESRLALASGDRQFQEEVFVRARARAVLDKAAGQLEIDGIPLLQPPPSQVRHVVADPVTIFDRVSLLEIDEVDPLKAVFAYYPGAIIQRAHGALLVTSLPDSTDADVWRDGDSVRVDVEPFSEDWSSCPERTLLATPDAPLDFELRHLGERPLKLALSALAFQGVHHATRYVDPESFALKQRRRFGRPTDDGNALDEGHAYTVHNATQSLLIDVGTLTQEADSDLHAGIEALFISAVRMSLGLVFSSDDGALDVSLIRLANDETTYLAFFELAVGGTGAIQALERDGVGSVLRLARLIMERVLSHERLLMRYCDRVLPKVPSDDVLVTTIVGNVEASARRLTALRQREKALRECVLEWLDAHLPDETGAGEFIHGRSYPNGYELGQTDVSDLGRAWVASVQGVSDLRWTRLHWFAVRGEERRSADVAFSQDLLSELRQNRRALTEDLLLASLKDVPVPPPPSHGQVLDLDAVDETAQLLSVDVGHALADETTVLSPEESPRESLFRRLWRRLFGSKRAGMDESAELQEALGESDSDPSASREGSEALRGKVLKNSSLPEIRRASLRGFVGENELPLVTWEESHSLLLLQEGLARLVDEATPILESFGQLLEANLTETHLLLDEDSEESEVVIRAALLESVMAATSLIHPHGDTLAPSLPGLAQRFRLAHPVVGLHQGETNALTAAAIVAVMHAHWGRPAGLFVNASNGAVMAALHLGTNPSAVGSASSGAESSTPSSDAREAIGSWRQEMLLPSNVSPQAIRRLRDRPSIHARPPGASGWMVAVDLSNARTLTDIGEEQRGNWYYIPLNSLGMSREVIG